MSSMRPPMFAGPMDRHVKLRRTGSSLWWMGGRGGGAGWKPWALRPCTPSAHSAAAAKPAPRRIPAVRCNVITAAAPCWPEILLLEVDLRRRLYGRGRLEIRVFLETEQLGGHVRG